MCDGVAAARAARTAQVAQRARDVERIVALQDQDELALMMVDSRKRRILLDKELMCNRVAAA